MQFFKKLFLLVRGVFARTVMLGEINNRFFGKPVVIDDPEFGSSTKYPTVCEIDIRDIDKPPADVGKKVSNIFFRDRPRILFNVCFTCGKAGLFTRGVYGDPHSIWFNVSCGYYELTVAASEWGRPFGRSSGDESWEPVKEELMGIGKSDWNYFSNYIYGVPEDAVSPCNAMDEPGFKLERPGPVSIGEKQWDVIILNDFKVVSVYTARGGGKLVSNDPVFTPIWRLCFGNPSSRPGFEKSFMPTRLKAAFYMTYKKEFDDDLQCEAYKTFIFGGTINLDYPENAKRAGSPLPIEELEAKNERFLALQLKAARDVIVKYFGDLGREH